MRRFNNHNYLKKSSPSAKVFTQKKNLDYWLLGITLFLTLFGLLMVYDSSQVEAFNDFGDKYYLFRQQVIWVVLGLFGMSVATLINHRIYQRFSLILLVFSVILLLLVFIPGLGVKAGGAHRWLRLGFFSIQPAEIVKLTTIIFLATLFQKGVRSGPFLVLLGVVVLIIGALQKDLGSAIIYSLICFGIYYLANGPIRYFIPILVAGLIGFVGFVMTSPYRIRRVMAFLDPFADTQGYTYHISQVLIALGSGGFWGVGVGQSRQKFAYIPEVSTDSIFSVIGEEFGFVGGMVLLACFGLLVYRGFKIAQNTRDNYQKLLACGLTMWLGSQAVVNLAAMVSLIPLTGVPLPFISYGGSALLANLVAVGILLNISKESD